MGGMDQKQKEEIGQVFFYKSNIPNLKNVCVNFFQMFSFLNWKVI